MLRLKTKSIVDGTPAETGPESKQPRRLVLALFILLVALCATLVRDRKFWFGGGESSGVLEGTAPEVARKTEPKLPAASPAAPTPVTKAAQTAKPAVEPKAAEGAEPGVTASNRTVLPPLDVEVVAGDRHSKIHPGSNATKVTITGPGSSTPMKPGALTAATNAADKAPMAETTLEAVYPPLAQQMKVQGSVVMQAIIGVDGAIQDLQVVSGPNILVSAAQQAVREWKFKPYLLNGQPVETKAKITVNFTIKVADESPRNS